MNQMAAEPAPETTRRTSAVVPGAGDPIPARHLRNALLLFVVALAVRLVLLILLGAGPEVRQQLTAIQDGPSYLATSATFPLPYEQPGQTQHFPGYSFFIWLFAGLFDPATAAVAVSMLASSLAVAVTYLIGYRLGWPAMAGALLFCFFPFRWLDISVIAMSEGVLVLAVALHIYFLIQGRGVLAGLALAVAVLTKITALFFVPLGLVFLFQRDLRRLRASVVAVVIGGVAALALFAYFHLRFGDFLLYFHHHPKSWGGNYFAWPGESLVRGFFAGDIHWMRKPYMACLLVFYLGTLVLAVRWLPRKGAALLWVWLLLGFLPVLVLKGGGRNWGFISFPRLILPATPPALLLFGALVPRRVYPVLAIVLLVGSLAYAVWILRVHAIQGNPLF